MPIFIQVAFGGAVGALLRYSSIGAAKHLFGAQYPYGTMFVNVVGSLLMGVAAVIILDKMDGRYSPLIMTGILGGFTTFSAFSLDAIRLLENGRMMSALVYIGGSVILAIGALFLGMAVSRLVIT